MLLVEDQGQEEGLCQGAEIVVLFCSIREVTLICLLCYLTIHKMVAAILVIVRTYFRMVRMLNLNFKPLNVGAIRDVIKILRRKFPGKENHVNVDENIDYESLGSEEKLTLILTKVSLNENRFKRIEGKLDIEVRNQKRLTSIEKVIRSYEDRIKLLEYKSIDIEARGRSNNLLLYGFGEQRNEDCRDKIARSVIPYTNGASKVAWSGWLCQNPSRSPAVSDQFAFPHLYSLQRPRTTW